MKPKLDYKEKVNRFLPLFYELGKEHGLDGNTMSVYAFIYNVCMQLNDNGYCGYSNEYMSKELGIPLASFKKYLAKLVELELVLVSNPGKRTKKPGESREIRINPSNYIIVEEQTNIFEQENEILKAQLNAALNEIEKLKAQARCEQGNWIMAKLYKKGFFTDKEYNDAHMYNVLFDQLLKETNWGWCEKFCFRFDTDPGTVKDKYQYIASTVHKQIKRFKEVTYEGE